VQSRFSIWKRKGQWTAALGFGLKLKSLQSKCAFEGSKSRVIVKLNKHYNHTILHRSIMDCLATTTKKSAANRDNISDPRLTVI